MKSLRLVFLTILSVSMFVSCTTQSTFVGGSILVNSLGYQPVSLKKATLLKTAPVFYVVDANTGRQVFKGKAQGPFKQDDVDQTAWIADFSSLNETGNFFLQTKDGAVSDTFTITDGAWNEAFYTAMRGFYLWRCGTAVQGTHNGITYQQKACHTNDGYLDYTEFGKKHKDGTGGWHDAGDYGKYTVNTGVSLGLLFWAWDNFEDKLADYKLDIPNTAKAYPDFLKELKWETDWLLKMQYPDNSGRVFHKLTRLSFSSFIMPSEDTEKRYFAGWGTSATAHFTGNMAQAARYFKAYDEAYASTCLEAAKKSYEFLQENPDYIKWEQEEFHTGAYQCSDTGARLWAAAELWETTGEPKYLADFEHSIQDLKPMVSMNWDWGNVGNLGVYTYLLSDKEGKNKELEDSLKAMVIAIADSIEYFTRTDIYGRPFERYYWGCNGTVARLSANLHAAFMLTGDEKYKKAGESIIAHIFGRNYYHRSFVTGLGINPPMSPHDRRCGADSIDAPWPGYIVGGGHTATDWVDKEESYSHNEIAINWQAALVYALAWHIQ